MGTEAVVTGAREEVLHRIRVALGFSTGDAAVVGAEYAAVAREYKRAGTLGGGPLQEKLEERLRDYDASVVRVKTGGVAAAIATILGERGKRRLVVPQGLAEALGEELPAGFEFVVDEGMTTSEICPSDFPASRSTSTFLRSQTTRGLPPMRPCALARSRPATVRSLSLIRSCLAIDAKMLTTASRNVPHESRYCSVKLRYPIP